MPDATLVWAKNLAQARGLPEVPSIRSPLQLYTILKNLTPERQITMTGNPLPPPAPAPPALTIPPDPGPIQPVDMTAFWNGVDILKRNLDAHAAALEVAKRQQLARAIALLSGRRELAKQRLLTDAEIAEAELVRAEAAALLGENLDDTAPPPPPPDPDDVLDEDEVENELDKLYTEEQFEELTMDELLTLAGIYTRRYEIRVRTAGRDEDQLRTAVMRAQAEYCVREGIDDPANPETEPEESNRKLRWLIWGAIVAAAGIVAAVVYSIFAYGFDHGKSSTWRSPGLVVLAFLIAAGIAALVIWAIKPDRQNNRAHS